MDALSNSEIQSVQKRVVEAANSSEGLGILRQDVDGAIEIVQHTVLGFENFRSLWYPWYPGQQAVRPIDRDWDILRAVRIHYIIHDLACG